MKLYSFIYNFIYVFIFGCTRSLFLYTWLFLLLWLSGSVIVMHQLSFQAACGIFLPRPGIEPIFPALLGRLLMIGPPGESTYMVIFNCIYENIFLKTKVPTKSINNFYNI